MYHREISTIKEWRSELENSKYTILIDRAV